MHQDDYKRFALAIVQAHREQRMADVLRLIAEFEQALEYEAWRTKIDKGAVALRQLRYQVLAHVAPDVVRQQVRDIIRGMLE